MSPYECDNSDVMRESDVCGDRYPALICNTVAEEAKCESDHVSLVKGRNPDIANMSNIV
jgi:hypothetical protein